jgi:hypothetical protein
MLLWTVTPCNFGGGYQRFGDTWLTFSSESKSHRPWKYKQNFTPKHIYPSQFCMTHNQEEYEQSTAWKSENLYQYSRIAYRNEICSVDWFQIWINIRFYREELKFSWTRMYSILVSHLWIWRITSNPNCCFVRRNILRLRVQDRHIE